MRSEIPDSTRELVSKLIRESLDLLDFSSTLAVVTFNLNEFFRYEPKIRIAIEKISQTLVLSFNELMSILNTLDFNQFFINVDTIAEIGSEEVLIHFGEQF